MENFDMNMNLRSWVIERILKIEESTSTALKGIFKIFKDKPKTVGNTSDALPFKSKIDLLLDIDEIDKIEYDRFIKISSIRNQFAHNYQADSFESIENINSELTNYLKKQPEWARIQEANKQINIEDLYKKVFDAIALSCFDKIKTIVSKYNEGMQTILKKHISHIVLNNIDNIWQLALDKITDTTNDNLSDKITEIFLNFKLKLSEAMLEESKKLGEDNYKKLHNVLKQQDI